ncbi:MAG: 4-oxalocrotonate tautomerase [Clostridiales bacterium]|nr:4-oxalocrotonate tautomerase [Clostridiales bacterium]
MPHISIKMLKGRTDEQKNLAVKKLTDALCDALGCSESHVSVSVEDYTAQQWQNVFDEEIANNPAIIKKPGYDPKDLL